MAWIRQQGLFALVALISMFAYGYFLPKAPFEVTDTATYVRAAQDLADGHLDELQLRTPGFPLLLLATGIGHGFFYTAFVLHALSAWFLLLILGWLKIKLWQRWLVFLLALSPPYIQSTLFVATEALAAPCLVAAVVALHKTAAGGRLAFAVLSGVLIGCATMARPTFALFGLVAAAILLLCYRRQLLRHAVLVGVVSLLFPVGYSAFNAFRFNYPGLTYGIGFHFGTRIPSLFPYIPDASVRKILLDKRNEMFAREANYYWTVWQSRPALREKLGMSEVQLANYMLRLEMSLVLHHPVIYIQQVARTLSTYWFPYHTDDLAFHPLVKPLSYGLQFVVTGLFFAGQFVIWGTLLASKILRLRRPMRTEPLFAFSLATSAVFYVALVSCAVDWGEARYRSVTELLAILSVVLAANWLWEVRASEAAERN